MASSTYALWLRPFGETAFDIKERIHELSETYDTPSFEPHITLLSGLEDKETRLIQFTDTLANSLQPFTIELTSLNYSEGYYEAFYAGADLSDDLLVAHQTARDFFNCSDHTAFNPHLSLMYGHLAERKKKNLLKELGPQFYLSFPVHSLLLIKTDGAIDDWEKIHTAEFSHDQHK